MTDFHNIIVDEDQPQPQQVGYGSNQIDNPQKNEEDKYQSEPQQVQEDQGDKKPAGGCGFLTVEYYQPFFNVTQTEVGNRMKLSLIPYKAQFFDLIRNKPDLWGPFWVCTSLIFMLAAAGNFSAYLYTSDKSKYQYKYNFVSVAAALIYCIGFGTPIVMTVLMKCFGSNITFFQNICLYGYSMACYVPVILLCIIPVEWFQWLLLVYATANSIVFLIINLWSEFARFPEQKKYLIFGIIIGCQLVFLFVFKLWFFYLAFEETKEDDTSSSSSSSSEISSSILNTSTSNEIDQGGVF